MSKEVENWLLSRRKLMFTKGQMKTVSIRMPEQLHKELKRWSEDRGYCFSDFVREALDQVCEIYTREVGR